MECARGDVRRLIGGAYAITIALAIGFDPWFFEAHRSAWQSAGYFITSAGSIGEAIDHFTGGDFDLVILGGSIPDESREGLTCVIRASGSRIPVVCIKDSCGPCEAFTDVTIKDEPRWLLQTIRKLLAGNARRPAVKPATINRAIATQLLDIRGTLKVRRSSVLGRAGWVAQTRPGIDQVPILPGATCPHFTVCLKDFGLQARM